MLLHRYEPTAGPDDTAAPAPAQTTSGGLKAWLPLIITFLAMPALAYVMTAYVLVPRLQAGLGITKVEAAEIQGGRKAAVPGRKATVMLNRLLVNVAGTMGSRYLLVSAALEGTDPDFNAKVQSVEPQLRDMACGSLSTKTLADLEKPGIRNLVRSELLSGFNNILGGPVVQDIYFTEFAIQ